MKNIYSYLKSLHLVCLDDEIENIKELSNLFSNYFKKVTVFSDPEDFLFFYEENNEFDILLCDIEMPKINGFDIIDKIRKDNHKISIIIQSAYSTNDYLFKSVNKNIQHYLVKPICFTKLNEALSSAVDYHKIINKNEEETCDINEFKYYYESGILENNFEKTYLNTKEREILNLLLKNKNHAVSYEEIENKIWTYNDEYMTENALRTVVKTLRKKIKDDNKFIKNISRIGYIYSDN